MTSNNLSRLWTGFLLLSLLLGALGTAAGATARPARPVKAAKLDNGSWPSPQNVSNSPGVDSEAPALAVTDTAVAHLVWEEGDELYHSYQTGGSWSEPERIRGTGDGEQPALAAGPDGTVHLAYVNNLDIFHVSWDASGWDIPESVSGTEQVSDAPDIAVGTDGSIHVVAAETAANQLYYAETDGILPWTYLPIVHDLGYAYGEAASIDIVGTSTVHLAYEDELEDIYVMEHSGSSWTRPQNISISLDASSTAPDVVTDENGTAHVAWQEDVGGTEQIQYAQEEDWAAVVTLSSSSEGARLPALTTVGKDQPHVFWQEQGSPSAIRHASYVSSASSWGSPSTVYESDQPLRHVVASSDRNGTLHTAWVEGSTGEVLYARREPHRVFLPLLLANGVQ